MVRVKIGVIKRQADAAKAGLELFGYGPLRTR